MDALKDFNAWPIERARAELLRCCGSPRWAERMAAGRPYADAAALYAAAEHVWRGLEARDWEEAFREHPRIGGRDALRAKFAATRAWAQGEQAGVREAEEAVLEALAEGNRLYEERFGRLFIVCATGKSASEMLALLKARLANAPEAELAAAAGEQEKITRLRLEKMLR